VLGLKKICSVFGIEPKGLDEREAQIWAGMEDLQLIRGKSRFHGRTCWKSPGSVPSSLRHDSAGNRYSYMAPSGAELAMLEKTCQEMVPLPKIVEKPDNYNQIQRIKELKPDLVLLAYLPTH